MSRSEFRWNKKRKHYCYIFKQLGHYYKNILLTTEPIFINKKRGKVVKRVNIVIFCHPNPNKRINAAVYYIVNFKPYIDYKDSFSKHVYKNWKWDKHDKRTIKRFKNYKKYKVYFDSYK